MAINFCHQLYHTKITSDKVSVDGHEAEQLISAGSKGFIAESFIRAPVNIICTFACNVDIHKIVVCGKAGAQKSTGFEIFAYHEKRNATKLGQQEYQFKDSYVCQSIGKAMCQDKTTFCFFNSMYRPREPFVGICSMPSHSVSPEDKMETQLRSPYQRNLSAVSYLIVRIIRTVRSVPCVGWLEVWGQPSASSHAQIIADVFSIYRKITCPIPVSKGAAKRQHSTTNDQTNSIQNDVSIPDDFLDPITQEIMTLPVLLPSGHTVDQTTLDRHEKEEAQWGRSASDPYTGVPFSKTNMTQQNTSLKVRIDHFVLKHGAEISVANRTLGASVIGNRNATVSHLTKARTLNIATPGLPAAANDEQPPCKRLKTEPTTSYQNNSTKAVSGKDLDSLLEEALSGLPSYTVPKPTTSSLVHRNQLSVPSCVVCKTAVNISLLYKLSCEHYMCRTCLLKAKAASAKVQCCLCLKVTESCDIIKAHQ